MFHRAVHDGYNRQQAGESVYTCNSEVGSASDRGCGAVEINLLAAYWGSLLAELKWGRAVTSVWFGSIICSLKWCVGPKLLWQQFPYDPKRYGTIQTGNKEYGSSD